MTFEILSTKLRWCFLSIGKSGKNACNSEIISHFSTFPTSSYESNISLVASKDCTCASLLVSFVFTLSSDSVMTDFLLIYIMCLSVDLRIHFLLISWLLSSLHLPFTDNYFLRLLCLTNGPLCYFDSPCDCHHRID